MKARIKETGKWITVDTCDEGFYDVETHDIYEPDELDFAPSFDWAEYRREAAKDIACSIVHSVTTACGEGFIKNVVRVSIELADELIKQLQSK